ncbi:MAG TPA: co-chaperone GroES [bacterium]|nr:co-chaperone GroES [bacterium]
MSDRVVLKGQEPENTTKSGIIIPPKNNPERPFIYEVLAVGPGKVIDGKREPVDLAIGDRVFVGQYAGDDVELEDETGTKQKYKIVGADYVLAKIA